MTAKEFFKENSRLRNNEVVSDMTNIMIEFAKYHVEQALKSGSNKALIEYGMNEDESLKLGNPVYDYEYKYTNFDSLPTMGINRNSILNAYPLENIK